MSSCTAPSRVDQFMTPHQRRYRIWNAIRNNGHKVILLRPGRSYDIPLRQRGIFGAELPDQWISRLEEQEVDVGFPTGAINKTTVVEVTNHIAQRLMDELELEPGAQIWTPRARYFLFDYVEPSALPVGEPLVRGLRIVNDGEWIQYPGNLVDGHLVHWEYDPWEYGTHPLPRKFWDYYSPVAS